MRVASMLIGCVLYVCGCDVVCAQTAVAAPASPSCVEPDVAPKTLTVVPPVYPAAAAILGITGEVVVLVTLDEHSHIVAVAIDKSPSVLLNNAALEATRASTFQTTVTACVPTGGLFRSIVRFVPPASPPPGIATYFRGAWSCVAGDGHAASVTYSIAGDGLEAAFARIDAGTVNTNMRTVFSQVGDKIALVAYAPAVRYAAASGGFDGNQLVFRGRYYPIPADPTPTQVAITYEVTDETHYRRTIATGIDPDALTVQHIERCERQRIQAR